MSDDSKNANVLKVRDDHDYIKLIWQNNENQFTIKSDQKLDWCADNVCTKSELRSRIEPWLTSLFQSEHLSLLVGSGLTNAIQHAACGSSDNGMDENVNFTVFADEIKQAMQDSAAKTGRQKPNIEDEIRVVNEVIKGLIVLQNSSAIPDVIYKLSTLRSELEKILQDFTNNISVIEASIAGAEAEKREAAFSKLVLFLMSFASRTGTRDRLNIFTTNYDRLIEAGADVAGLRLIDRFVGVLSPIFRSSRMDVDMHYNPPGIRGEPRYLEGVARFTKLHGSLDWINVGEDIRRIGLPFGAKTIQPFLETAGFATDYSSLMIYPNSAKDRETTEYPYVELFRDFAAALCRPNSTLVTYGYGFGDDHINRVIRDMLTIPSTHLVVIDFSDSTGRIKEKYTKWGHQSQMSLIIGQDIANIDDLVDYYLPKPSIDRASMRMADILKQRFNQPSKKEQEGAPNE
ncbi:SIR2 family protein [Treponema vincentii]|uniref:SIR2 family protein n=1 Tax=Treponema vincentii TaxID=69710 RepID=UPI0035F545B9